jgi:hypothetical protein
MTSCATCSGSSLSIDCDRSRLLASPETLEWTGEPVEDGRTRVAVVDDRVAGFATTTVVAEGLERDDLFVALIGWRGVSPERFRRCRRDVAR